MMESQLTFRCNLRFSVEQVWSAQDRKEILQNVSQWLLEPSLTLKIANSLRPVLEELVYLARSASHFSSGVHPSNGISLSLEYNIRLASALSKLCRVSPACITTSKLYFSDFDVLRSIETLWPLIQKDVSTQPHENDSSIFIHASELIIEVLRTTWRLVKLSAFSINQSALLSLLQKCESCSGSSSSSLLLLGDASSVVDFLQRVYILSSQCLAHTLGVSDSEIQSIPSFLNAQHSGYLSMIDEDDSGEYQLLLATASWMHNTSSSSSSVSTSFGNSDSVLTTATVHTIPTSAPSKLLTAKDLQSGLVDVSGFLLQNNAGAYKPPTHHNHQQLIITPTTSHNLEALALAIGNEKPVLLLGPTGSGKSALISHVASLVKREITTIHIGEALDGKNLLGGYVATEVPGQFRWVEGPLTRAVSQGHWLVIEDLDMASPEVYGILQPLVQSRQLFIPSRAETIYADHGFSLFATATTPTHIHASSSPSAASSSSSSSSSASLSRLQSTSATATSLAKLQQSSFWTKVVIDPLNPHELTQVLDLGFGLGQLSHVIVSTHESLIAACSKDGISLRATERPLTTRDVLRWAKRVKSALLSHMSASGHSESESLALLAPNRTISSGIRELALKEALDVYISPAQHSALADVRCEILASSWQISLDRLDLLRKSRPTLESTESACFVGRSSLAVNTNPKTLTPPLSTLREVFVPTTRSLGLLEWLSVAAQHVEPVLLVGETGGGKTSTIQHLAARTRRKLVVLNMSQSSDTVDLLGGFKPVDLSMLANPLKRIFDRIFIKTFSKTKNQEFIDRVHGSYTNKDWRTLAGYLAKSCKLATTKFEQRQQQEQLQRQQATPEVGSPPVRETKRRKTQNEELDEESIRQAFAGFDDLDAETFPSHLPMEQQWKLFSSRVQRFGVQVDGVKAFQYVEGALVKAVQRGEWVLLDEINLASAETLECLSGLLEGDSLVLSERGDMEAIPRHPDFRLFAAMNPANDVGKSNLPSALRARFSEFYLSELEDRDDLAMIVQGYLARVNPKPPAATIVDFYLTARKESETRLVDGSNQKPRFNLRSLSRALEYCADTTNLFGFDRALFEGIQLAFLTQLNTASYDIMNALIHKIMKTKSLNDKVLKTPPSVANFQRNLGGTLASSSNSTSSSSSSSQSPIPFEQFLLEAGPFSPFKDPRFILTATTQKHLTHLARALVTRKYPMLLQGPTSAGKTSMIEFLAKMTGHRFVRVNNSEQTDLQEYLGQYIHDPQGRLVYHDGVLVEALRHGHWIVLDELNLAPSEVLEALNRLLDDNRQLYVPELQEYITPHPHFCLFATQNPPGLYGGRKVLSRAFRSRFLELHIDDIPDAELQLILEQRSHLPASYCQRLVAIMKDLQRQRQGTQVFAGRHGFVTLRDLFRWAERKPTSYDELAIHGYFLLADRLREQIERDIVKQVLEKHLKVTLDMNKVYEEAWRKSFEPSLAIDSTVGQQNIVWTSATKRLFGLMSICLRHKEPILLVGPPGTGKTAISQLHAELLNQHLEILNCHQNSEGADFIGGLRPVRGKDVLQHRLETGLRLVFDSLTSVFPEHAESIIIKAIASLGRDFEHSKKVESEIATFRSTSTSSSSSLLDRLVSILPSLKAALSEFKSTTIGQTDFRSLHNTGKIFQAIDDAEEQYAEYSAMFLWYDGPLVRTMKRGQCFLVDEISLAEDAVLERLNSVLEPSRLLVLAEKGGREIEEITAHPDFRIIATMNPGGDFGKKELSPALRNRFTEIYVPAVDQREDLLHIIINRLTRSTNLHNVDMFAEYMVDFVDFFAKKTSGTWSYSLRDILAWADFIVATSLQLGSHSAYHHGASMLILDGLGITNPMNAESLKKFALEFLDQQKLPDSPDMSSASTMLPGSVLNPGLLVNTNERFGIGCFTVPKMAGMDMSASEVHLESYSMKAPTTLSNLLRLLRALQLPKPLLLEGSPGVGKTTIIEALGAACGRNVVRINLSEQTDMLDLLGADLPVEDNVQSLESSDSEHGNTAKFEWRDGVFLNALKNGDWVLLDELNLANQSVLEGLNAVLDHRGTVFIPELNASFVCPPTFRIFAAQNPTAQGGGRKGLPKSFLNRFTKVYLDSFTTADLNFIANALFPEIGSETISQMVEFNTRIHKATMETFTFGRDGAPWEFNLRDILRWCKLVKTSADNVPDAFVQLLYMQRFRTEVDREHVKRIFQQCFYRPLVFATATPYYQITHNQLQVGRALLDRVLRPNQQSAHATHHGSAILEDQSPLMLQHLLPSLESLMKCVEFNWLAILVGPTASGKTSLLKLLAWLTGNNLTTFSVNPSVDTLEILGGFEQIDLNRHAKKVVQRMSVLVSYITRLLLEQSSTTPPSLDDAYHLTSMWNLFQSQVKAISSEASFSGKSIFASESQRRVTTQLLHQLDMAISKLPSEVSQAIAANGIDTTSSLRAAVAKIGALEAKSVAGSFEWVDGLLIEAMERGHWIVLDNVNTCPGPVLDRLLPLLEPNGILRMNERGLVDGKVVEIVPHPNFRIFFTMDPKYGDISRAMRNRGIEIGMTAIPTEIGSTDMTRLLSRSLQLHLPTLFERMTAFHNSLSRHPQAGSQVNSASLPIDAGLGLSDLLHWAELTLDQLQRGEPLPEALTLSMEQVYARSQPSPATRHHLRSHFITTLANLDIGTHQQQLKHQVLNSPGFIDRYCMLTPQASALSMFTHSQTLLETMAAPIMAGTSTFFSLQHLLRSCSTHWAKQWLTSLTSYSNSNASIIFEGDSSHSESRLLNELVEWMAEQFQSSPIVQAAQRTISACIAHLLDSNNKDASAWLQVQSNGCHPTDVQRNIPLWRILSSLAKRDASSWEAYCSACADIDRVRLWTQTLPQAYDQVRIVDRLNKLSISNASIGSLSIIEQSLALTLRKTSKSSVTHQLATLLSSFFAELDVVLEHFISDSALLEERSKDHVPSSPSYDALVQDLQLLINLRHHLWRWLLKSPSDTFQVRDFVPPFNWLLKSLRRLQSRYPSHFMNTDALEVITNHMNSIIFEELGRKYKATLWKREGHPLPPKNAAFFGLQTRLNGLNVSQRASLKDSENVVLRALATLMWLNTFPESAPKSQINALFNSISHVPESVESTIASLPEAGRDVSGSSQRSAELQAEHKHPLMAPIFDHHLLQLEVHVIQSVQALLATRQSEASINDIGAKLAPLVPTLQHILRLSAEHTQTPPRLLASYQLLLWIIESNGSSVVQSSRSVVDASATFHLIQSIHSEMRANLCERSLQNSLSTAQLVLPEKRDFVTFLPPIVIEQQKKTREKDMSRRELLDHQFELEETAPATPVNDQNPIRLESAYRAAYIMSRLNEWKHVPVVMKELRMDQMKTLLSFLSSSTSAQESSGISSGFQSVEHEWIRIINSFSTTLQCFCIDKERTRAISHLGHAFSRVILDGDLQSLSMAESALKDSEALSGFTTDARYVDLAPDHVAEIVALLTRTLSYSTSYWNQVYSSTHASFPFAGHQLEEFRARLVDEPIMRQWRGRVQIELAMFRAALLIPSQPIDDTAKYASRSAIIESMKEQVEVRIAVLSSAEKSFTGASSNHEIEQEKEVLRRLEILLAEARERQVSRPLDCPAFHVFWSHLHTIFQSHCAQSRYHDLARSFALIRTLPRNAVFTQWQGLLIRESQFQNNITQAVFGLQSRFQKYYPDIVGPFISCLHEIKTSLRLIRFSAELMMPSSLLIGTSNVDSMASLVNELQLQEGQNPSQESDGESTFSLHTPSLSCSADSLYSITSHLQQVINRLAQVPRIMSSQDIALILSKTTFEAVTALARLNQVRAQATLAEGRPQDLLTKGSALDAKMTQWMLAASRTSSVLQLQSALLRASLDAVFSQTRTQGYISQESYDSLDRIFIIFVETYQAARAEEEKKRAAEAEFYKYKTRDTKVEHQHDVNEASFRSMFPDYYEDFEDILGKERDKRLDLTGPVQQFDDDDAEGEAAYKRKKIEEEVAANSATVVFQGKIYQLSDGEIYQLCRIHFKVFSILRTYLQPGVQELADATYYDELEELENAISTNSKAKKSSQSKLQPATVDPTSSARWKRQAEERNHVFTSAYDTASKIVALMGEMLPRGGQDSALEPSHILALQQCIDELTANWRNPTLDNKQSGPIKKKSKQKRVAARQRRLEAAKAAVVTTFMSSHELVPNFYTFANAAEASLLQEPLSAFQQRIEDLLGLEEIGENQILITLWKLVTRLLEADVTLPLMHFITGLELLIERSQDWDLYQPVRYGIREHMNACAKFVTRWRAMELQFWPQLLTTKEQEFQIRAAKWWFFLYSLLHETAAKTYSSAAAVHQSGPDFPGLLSALQEYIENSAYGEFATRLHLLVSFYYQFQAEYAIRGSTDTASASRHHALVTMLYNVYRYYAQFLPLLQTEMFKLKEAVQLKLEDFIKISKWDDSTFYRLRKTTEASHRNLSKFVKQYEDEVLSLPFRGFLEMVASNESLEQLRKETIKAVIVSGTRVGSTSSASSDTGSKQLMQTLVEMKTRCKQLVVPLSFGAIYKSSQLATGVTSPFSSISGLHQKLESLFGRVSKHSGKLLPQQFEYAQRSHVQLERLTSELIEGILEMRLVEQTPVKKRAFSSMMKELKNIGLDHHKTAVKSVLLQQTLISQHKGSRPLSGAVIDIESLHELAFLFSEPVCEEIVAKLLLVVSDATDTRATSLANERSSNLLTESLDTFWAKSDDYFYKVLAQLLLLRSKEHSHSPQLSRAEAQKSLGFADHTFALLVHQRRTMSIALARHETIEKLSSSVARLTSDISSPFSSTPLHEEETGPKDVLPPQTALKKAMLLQKEDIDAFSSLVVSMMDVLNSITGLEVSTLRNHSSSLLDLLKTIFVSLTDARSSIEKELSAHTETSSLSRVFHSDSICSPSSSLVMGYASYAVLKSSDDIVQFSLEKLMSQSAAIMPRLLPQLERFASQRTFNLLQRNPSLGIFVKTSPSSEQRPTTSMDVPEPISNFLQLFNSSIESLLLAVQRVYKIEKYRTESENRKTEERLKQVEEHKAAVQKAAEEAKARDAARRAALPSSSSSQQQQMDVTEEPSEDKANNGDEDEMPPPHVFGMEPDSRFDSELSGSDRFLPLHIVESMKHLDSLTIALDAPSIIDNFSRACAILADFLDTTSTAMPTGTAPSSGLISSCATLLRQFYPLLKQWSALHLAHVHSRSLFCKSSSKFAHVLVSVFASIMKDGFCIKPKAEADAEEGDMMTDVDGMGLGEGTGDQDVTDQYDEEEQLLGDKPLKDLKKDEQQQDPTKPPVDPDTGVEMENDFEGEMHDVEQKDPKQNESDGEDDEEDDGDLMDREMGDLDPEQEEVLDERLWNDEDNEDDDADNGKGKESYEKNAPLEGDNKDESEMEARLDDEKEGDANNNDDKKKQKKPKKSQDGDDEEGGGGDEESGDKEKDDEREEGEEGDEPGADDPIRNADDDRYEDTHHKQPHAEEEEFELPEDMNLDDEKNQGGDEEEQNKMDLDGEDEEEKEGGDDGNDAAKPFPEQPEGAPSDDQPPSTEPDVSPDEEQNKDQDANADDDNDEKKDDDDTGPGTSAAQPMDDGDQDQDQQGEEEGKDDDEEREKVGQSKDDGKDYSGAFGITDDPSLPQQQNVRTNEDNKQVGGGQEDNMQSRSQEETSDPNATSVTAGTQGSSSFKPTPSRPNNPKEDPNQQHQQQQTPDKQAATQQKDANPLRSLGDALKHWERQLNVIEDRDEKAVDQDDSGEPAGKDDNDDGAMDADKDQTFEFARDNEKADQQTLGIASEEQSEQFKNENHQMALQDEEDQPQQESVEPEKMEVDDTPPDPEQNTTVESKSRAPSNRLQTQNDVERIATSPEEKEDEKKTGAEELEDGLSSDGDDHNLMPNYESIVSKPSAEKEAFSMDVDDEIVPRELAKDLTPEDLLVMRTDLELSLAKWKSDPNNVALGGEIWRQLQAITSGAAQQLCEQLRLLLEPTLKSKMQGDYRTGKRLNMRRVVTYVASQFRKDKIWLRRTMPNKRTYQVLLCLDDSQSVLLGNAAPLMREATATLCLALQRLQIGQLGLLKFGNQVDLLHPFSAPFTDEAASVVMPQLTFEQQSTNMENLMRTSIQMLELSRHEAVMSMGSSSASTMQLMFIIGDGRFGDKRQELALWLHRAQQNNIFVVFLIMDTLDKDQSILDIQSVSASPSGKIAITPYIDDFPFAYYIILKHLDNLPHILSDALRQWFEMVNQSDRR